MKLSIVTTLFYSEADLGPFYERMRAVAETITDDLEFVLVNDGSPDDSLGIATSLMQNDPRVRAIDLSRNFGQHKAMMVGLEHAQGDLVMLIDCDGEEDPELLARFHEEMHRSGADVVYGERDRRDGWGLDRFLSGAFYAVFNALASIEVPSHILNARLMTARYVSALLQHREREFYMAGLWALTGFSQVAVVVPKPARSKSTYTLRRKILIAVNAITSFSSAPLNLIFYVGCATLLTSIIAAGYLLWSALFRGTYLVGWPSLIVSTWLLAGLTIFCLGVIGIYLSKVFVETKRRPFVIVRDVYEHDERVRPPQQ